MRHGDTSKHTCTPMCAKRVSTYGPRFTAPRLPLRPEPPSAYTEKVSQLDDSQCALCRSHRGVREIRVEEGRGTNRCAVAECLRISDDVHLGRWTSCRIAGELHDDREPAMPGEW
jgi:hypothetical protein